MNDGETWGLGCFYEIALVLFNHEIPIFHILECGILIHYFFPSFGTFLRTVTRFLAKLINVLVHKVNVSFSNDLLFPSFFFFFFFFF
jgi:hypothetical protein